MVYTSSHPFAALLATALGLTLAASGCATEPSDEGTSDSSDSSDGGDGETSESDSGSGDGDGSTGDGDGDGSSGDGDGSSGDGDGSSGDGDGTSGDGDGDGTSGLACFQVYACAEACPDQACVDACFASGSASGAAEAGALQDCIDQNGCTNDNCIEQNCGAEITACSIGSASCSESWTCLDACAGDEFCETGCTSEGSAVAQALLGPLADCAESNGCTDQACIDANCNAEQTDCEMVTELECPLLLGCYIDCGGDASCESLCDTYGGSTAVGESQAVLSCGAGLGCGDDVDCMIQGCPSEWNACSTGAIDCGGTWACFEGCNGGEICEQNCAYAASAAGQILFQALVDCSEANGCDDQACLDANCSLQQTACM
jgi:hypothetical protein